MELGLPFRRHGGARQLLAAQIDLGDPPRIGDVVEWIGVEHNEVRALARRYGSGVSDFQEFGRVACRCDDASAARGGF